MEDELTEDRNNMEYDDSVHGTIGPLCRYFYDFGKDVPPCTHDSCAKICDETDPTYAGELGMNYAEFVVEWRDFDDAALRVCQEHLPKAIRDLYDEFGHAFSVSVYLLNPGVGFFCELEGD